MITDPSTPALVELPLFPLNTVLFPDGSLNLQIFEVRYLDMVGKCYKTGTPFGVVSLVQGAEVRQRDPNQPTGEAFAQEAFADVGTLAHIVEFATPQAGLMVIRCQGGARFRIRERRQLKHGLWMADADPIAPDLPTDIPADLQPFAHALEHLVRQQQDLQPALHVPVVVPPFRYGDCGWVANRWCDVLAIRSSVKQGLLQLDSPLLRLELVGDLLLKKSQ
jgi:Lon protease-like protein